MNTITIPDPDAVRDLARRELPESDPSVTYGDGGRWAIHCWTPDLSFLSGHGSSPEEALSALKDRIATHNPVTKLEAEAKKHGMKLVPA